MSDQHTSTVLILGARGRLGSALAGAFSARGWRVIRQVRSAGSVSSENIVQADARSASEVLKALDDANIKSVNLVINACNPIYTRWATEALPLNEAAIRVAKTLNATLLFPGNVYNFGADMDPQLANDTPQRAQTRKGRIRIAMEQQLADAAGSGLQSIVIRAGDFFGSTQGSWFDLVIAKDLSRGKIGIPGSPEVPRAWAYVPDLANTFVNIATQRDTLARFEQVHFAGHTVSLQDVINAVSTITQRNYKQSKLPWPLIRTLSFAVPMWREIAELAYLWERPHQLVTAPQHQSLIAAQTPFNAAIRHAISLIHPALVSSAELPTA